MAHDDFEVIAYKLLSYAYSCIREGVQPSWSKAMEIAGCNPRYFEAVALSLMDSGYLARAKPGRDANGDPIGWGGDLRITLEGVGFLADNSAMGRVRAFLGSAFETVLKAAVESTVALGLRSV